MATKKAKNLASTRKSEGMRETIIRAATEIINEKSYALATLTGIAATLDMRDAALYYYFPNKQALAYACHRSSLERFEQLLNKSDEAGGTGEEKLRHLIRSMLAESAVNGPQLYFGDYSYLEAAQRKAITEWADRLKTILIRFLKEGMADGSIVQCEPELVTELLLGMLIWMAKWAPSVEGLTVDRMMNAFDALVFRGLERGHTLSAKAHPHKA
ncbi:MAG: TetR family transcriptional regulator [Comamonadaceae bacterium PBBC2]|nr:MAG: TetR family transcriptional regulator [Comamonadaceae bacterium PBBC2]